MIIKRLKLFTTNYKLLEWAKNLGLTPEEADDYIENNKNLSQSQIEAIRNVYNNKKGNKVEYYPGRDPSPADGGRRNAKLEDIDWKTPKHPKKGYKIKPRYKKGLGILGAVLVTGTAAHEINKYMKKKKEDSAKEEDEDKK